jgi:hypothetical protein
MTDEGHAEKVLDYGRDPLYERRLVIFYDILGWRNHIGKAGDDPKKIGGLRRAILQHVRIAEHALDAKVTTFSDNIVLSMPLTEDTGVLMTKIALMQLASALGGFLMRGGVAIGDVIHDDECVFGPALNRAYHLESQVAQYPRIVIDQDSVPQIDFQGKLLRQEDGVSFIDPFNLPFVRFVQAIPADVNKNLLSAGLPPSGDRVRKASPSVFLRGILENLKRDIRSPLEDREWTKVAWLYDRIAKQLGVPPANSYPRVRP